MGKWYARPVFHSADVAAAIDFYIRKLGFTEKWRFDDDVAQVSRGDCEIILSRHWPDKVGMGMLFIALDGAPRRLRVNGRAVVVLDDPELSAFPGAQALIRVTPAHIFPNCPRYIPDVTSGTPSAYWPEPGREPVEPAWKSFDAFEDVVPPRHPGTVTG